MPIGSGEEADGQGERAPNFGAVDGQAGWQGKRHMGQDADLEQQDEDKDGQLDQPGSDIRKSLSNTSLAEDKSQGEVKEKEKGRDENHHRDQRAGDRSVLSESQMGRARRGESKDCQ